MVELLYVSAIIVAIAFLILVIFVSKTLRSVQGTLDQVAGTLGSIEKQMQGITSETEQILHKTNVLMDDIQDKSQQLNTVVTAVKDVGTSIQGFNHSVTRLSNNVSQQLDQNQDKVSQVVQWSNVAMELVDKWNERKKKNNINKV
ncbi:hypothetical protein FIU87_16315 [Bacillus sp. THAF10]|uniref:DUF948 domain-containing protein n=1 Tax=Bacillus sp. THAF10 TaxID=2587848 RepID=UPI00126864E6|nr:DUF948 domain-containing protein [Bacillus sp. THAF10]QFT90229.1 hypothetical protein FIU87_16315 [Bacillus sp. THAF10]